jgi:hypothetical protein
MKHIIFSFFFMVITISGISQWTLQNPLPSVNTLNSVHFPTANTGYAVGYGGTIVKTSDAGATWTVLPSGTGCFLWSVYFTDSITGFAVGYDYDNSNGVILQTWDEEQPGIPGRWELPAPCCQSLLLIPIPDMWRVNLDTS